MNTFNTVGEAVNDSLLGLWGDVIGIIPELVSAIIILIIGFLIAAALGRLATRITQLLRIDKMTESLGIDEQLTSLGLSFKFSVVIGKIVKFFFIIVFLNASVELLGMSQITLFLNDVLGYLPNVFVAVVIMAIGLIVGQFVKKTAAKMITASRLKIKSSEALASIAMWVIIVFSGMAALIQLKIVPEMIQILFTAIVFALALSFGLAGKSHALKMLDAIFDSKD